MSVTLESKLFHLRIVTPDGAFVASYSPLGLAELGFPSASSAKAADSSSPIPATLREWHRLASTAVKEILAGRTPVKLPPLDVSRGTEFQQSVWRALLKIKCGQTQSYGEIAKTIGNPKGVRAVGGACGANPIPLLIPCHRVLAASRKIGGFSGGLGWKKKLLAREGVALDQ